MSRPIKLTDEILKTVQDEFIESIKKQRMFDWSIKYHKNFVWKDEDKATITFEPIAFAKMSRLLEEFETEVAWYGLASRDENNKTNFIIEDIIVYPQEVSGATVEMDMKSYPKWTEGLDDKTYNKIRMQGHSHVRMNTSPSSTDLRHQNEILQEVSEDSFYIFMIWNKFFVHTASIFDLKNNTLYDDKDIDVLVGMDGVDMDAFIKNAKGLVKTASYSVRSHNSPVVVGGKATAPAMNGTKVPTAETKTKQKKKNGTIKSDSFDLENERWLRDLGYGYGMDY